MWPDAIAGAAMTCSSKSPDDSLSQLAPARTFTFRHSDFWVKPFFNMFDLGNKSVNDTGGVFEPASLIAFIVYFIIGMVVLSILTASFGYVTRRRTYV